MTEERDETISEISTGPSGTAAPEGATEGLPELAAEALAGTEAASGLEPGPASADEPFAEASETPRDASLDEALPLVEALLFAASKPVAIDKLAEAAELPEAIVTQAVAALEASCAGSGRGIRLDRVAGGVRLVTRPEFDYPVRRLLGLDGKTKLSMAALETLAIVSYRQPVTGPEIAELRGVNSSSSIRTLLDRKLITTAGRKEVVGTPFLYKTTKEFLVHFGLKGLGDLPKPEELEAIYGLEAPRPDPAQVELFHVDEATGEVEDAVELPVADATDVARTDDADATGAAAVTPETAVAAPEAEAAATEVASSSETPAGNEDGSAPGESPAAGEEEHGG